MARTARQFNYYAQFYELKTGKLTATTIGDQIILSTLWPGAHPLGYVLLGWSYEPEGEVIEEVIIPWAENLNLYAIWDKGDVKKLTYVMCLDPDVYMEIGSSSPVNLPNTDNKLFKGWSHTRGGEVIGWDPYTIEKADDALYAIWTQHSNNRVMILKEEDGKNIEVVPVIGDEATLPECHFTPPALEVFDYWENPLEPGVRHHPGENIRLEENDFIIWNAKYRLVDSIAIRYYRNMNINDNVYVEYAYPPTEEIYFPVDQWPDDRETVEFLGWALERTSDTPVKDGRFIIQTPLPQGYLAFYSILGGI